MLGLQKISGIMKTEYPHFSPFRTYYVSFCPADGLYDLLSFLPFFIIKLINQGKAAKGKGMARFR